MFDGTAVTERALPLQLTAEPSPTSQSVLLYQQSVASAQAGWSNASPLLTRRRPSFVKIRGQQFFHFPKQRFPTAHADIFALLPSLYLSTYNFLRLGINLTTSTPSRLCTPITALVVCVPPCLKRQEYVPGTLARDLQHHRCPVPQALSTPSTTAERLAARARHDSNRRRGIHGVRSAIAT